ncbi:unnamed protein product [Protopolystoma xenopodis]|uniref:Uncharacterized protein n=1 Tax=Protopolystoma xenopodis TaxID=117903 RepID=A0A448WSI4_9PLAT|nr:unnamed protein product [Protopolystoma xenopodis]
MLDSALSRGGALPPFAIEFSCSCEATRYAGAATFQILSNTGRFGDSHPVGRSNWYTSSRATPNSGHEEILEESNHRLLSASNMLYNFAAWRYASHWHNVLTRAGLRLLANWAYYRSHQASGVVEGVGTHQSISLSPLPVVIHPIGCLSVWLHLLFRWNRPARMWISHRP